jgi:hypothetical protein
MKKILVTVLAAGVLTSAAHAQFLPGKLAVLRAGDNGTSKASNLANKHAPAFIDQIDPVTPNGTNQPSYTVAIPTNDPNLGSPQAMWFNGQAGTEGNLARSADRGAITWTGYGGDIFAIPGTPSKTAVPRGICVIDAQGSNHVAYESQQWYGLFAGQTNPRGVVSDNGTNDFWGSGGPNYGNILWDAADQTLSVFESVSSTRSVQIINGKLYTTLQVGDGGNNPAYVAGIYGFEDFFNNPINLPTSDANFLDLIVPVVAPYTSIEGFAFDPLNDVAYTADINLGVQKYIKSGGSWRLACAWAVPANEPANVNTGCFGLAVDFSGSHNVIYATTTEGYGGNVNSNRVIRLDDTNNITTGALVTNSVITLQTAWSTNIAFRGLAWGPDLTPDITTNPASISVVEGTPATFSVSAVANEQLSYQWQEDGTNLINQTSATLTLPSPTVAYDDQAAMTCIVSDAAGSVTSAPATLTVTASGVVPSVVTPPQLLTNAVGDTILISASASGTAPLTYQWFTNDAADGAGNWFPLSEANEFSGTATSTLTINNSQPHDATSYYLAVTNQYGSSLTQLVATVSLIQLPPLIIVQPSSTATVVSGNASFAVSAYGNNLSYQWLQGGSAVSGAEFSGANSTTLNITGATLADSNGVYSVAISNPGGAITSAPVTLSVIPAPAASFVAYTNIGQIYAQNFDSLPIPSGATFNTGNPVTIDDFNPANGTSSNVTYSLNDPFDFAFPIVSSGGIGGLGLSNTLTGWYGWGGVESKLGASQGDQSTGGDISFGAPNATNRALGLLGTSSTGPTAFAVKFVNESSTTLSNIDLSFVGELWREQGNPQVIQTGYLIDPAGQDAVFTTNGVTWVSNLSISFPVSTDGLEIRDGTQASNQVDLSLTNYAIAPWAPGSALWLIWEAPNDVGSAQGIAIDNLQFAAPNLAPVIVSEPLSQSVTAPNSASFSVAISNSFGATFQWYTNGVALNEGDEFTGTQTDALTVDPTAIADSATYTVLVSNIYGTTLSSNALLTVNTGAVKPTFALQPLSATNFVGDTVILTNFATGAAPILYQWQLDGANLPGAVNSALILSNITFADAGSYDVIASNSAGTNLSSTAILTVLAAPPAITNQPAPQTVAEGGTASFSVGVSGTPPITYQWLHDGTNLSSVNEFVGATSNILVIVNAGLADAGTYSVVVSGPGGGPVGSSTATLTVIPPPSFVAYTNAGQVYAQNFDSLPDPGLTSVPSAEPATIDGITYDLANPFDFAYPVLGANGGMGIAAMAGWYGTGSVAAQTGAQAGDQTKGGVISFGPTNSLVTSSNRSLGLLATSTSGTTAFAVRIVNQTGEELSQVNLAFTAELWRETANAKTVAVTYYVDPSGAAVLNTNNVTATLTNITFATGATSWGTNSPVSTTDLAFSDLAIDWPTNAALWFVWNMTSASGSSQGIGIDDLTFSASAPTTPVQLTISQLGANVVIGWPTSGGTNLQVNADLTQTNAWSAASQPVTIGAQTNSVTVPIGAGNQFFRLQQP